MRVELLYFEGCPSYERLLPKLRALVAAADPHGEVELRRVESIEDAERDDFGLKCRLYRWDGEASPVPCEQWIRDALSGGERRVRHRAFSG